jgi:hypothetical protein
MFCKACGENLDEKFKDQKKFKEKINSVKSGLAKKAKESFSHVP